MIGLYGHGGTRADYLAEARRSLRLARAHLDASRTGGNYEGVYRAQAERAIGVAMAYRAKAREASR